MFLDLSADFRIQRVPARDQEGVKLSLSFVLKSGKLKNQKDRSTITPILCDFDGLLTLLHACKVIIAQAWGYCYLLVSDEVFPEPRTRRAVNNLHAFLVILI